MYELKPEYLPHYTYEDYERWEGDWELIYGMPYSMAPSPGVEHQLINSNLHFLMRQSLQSCSQCSALFELDWKVDLSTVVRPDLLVVCKPYKKGPYLDKTPEIVVEIFSPSSANRDRTLKYDLYERQGVKYYLIVYPDKKSFELFDLKDGKFQKIAESGSFLFQLPECSFEAELDNMWVE